MENTNINKYHDIKCCEWTLGIDTLLARYKDDRTHIISLILKDPETLINTIWKPEGPLAIDNDCLCKMGQGEPRSPFACSQCKNLRRLIDFRMGGVERPFQLECGDQSGKNIIVTRKEVINPFLAWDDDATRRAQSYLHQYHNLTLCGTPDIALRCITGDPFTIRTLILWMIKHQFMEAGLPHCPTLLTAFICHDEGYSVYSIRILARSLNFIKYQNIMILKGP